MHLGLQIPTALLLSCLFIYFRLLQIALHKYTLPCALFVQCRILVLHVAMSCTAPDSPPRDCVAVASSSTSFKVAWSPPDPLNGIISNYTIKYRPVDAVADYDPSTLEGTAINNTEANTTMLKVDDLQSAVLYSIQLAVSNHVGISPFTEDLECIVLTENDGE